MNPDYDGPRKAAERWPRHHPLRHAGSRLRRPAGRQPRRARRRSPTARSRPSRTSSATVRSTSRPRRTSSRSRSRRACRTSAAKRASSVVPRSRTAINREEITDVIFNGTRTPAHDFTSPVIDGYSEDIPGSEVLDVRRRRGEEALGRGRRHLPVGRHLPDRLQRRRRPPGLGRRGGEPAQEQPRHRRVRRARTRPSPSSAPRSPTAPSRRAFRTGWQADYPALFNFLGPIYGTDAGSNDGDYSNPEFDALLDEGLAATDVDAANEKFQQAQEILFEDLPAIPLWYTNGQRRLERARSRTWSSAGTPVPLLLPDHQERVILVPRATRG